MYNLGNEYMGLAVKFFQLLFMFENLQLHKE